MQKMAATEIVLSVETTTSHVVGLNIAKIKLIFYSGSFSGKYTGTELQVCYCCKVSNFISLKN
jgi:hypothetical protein